MTAALLSAIVFGLVGLVAAAVLGLWGTDVSRHISFGFFSTMVLMLAHSMMMFYLIGKGKAVKDAMAENSLTGDYYRRHRGREKAGVLDRHAGDGRHDDGGDHRRERRHRA